MTPTPGGASSARSSGWATSCTSPRPATTPRPATAAPPRTAPGRAGAARLAASWQGCAHLVFPNLITGVATTDATVTDNQMTGAVHAGRPGRTWPRDGTTSIPATSALRSWSRRWLPGASPDRAALADTSAQARAGAGDARADFTVDYSTKTVACPQGKTSSSWTPCTQRGQAAAVATFSAADAAPARPAPSAPPAARNDGSSPYAPRPGRSPGRRPRRRADDPVPGRLRPPRRVEGTMHQAAIHGARRARYRGLPKTRLDPRTWPPRSTCSG